MLLNLHLNPGGVRSPEDSSTSKGKKRKASRAHRLFVSASERFLFSKNTASDRINHVSVCSQSPRLTFPEGTAECFLCLIRITELIFSISSLIQDKHLQSHLHFLTWSLKLSESKSCNKKIYTNTTKWTLCTNVDGAQLQPEFNGIHPPPESWSPWGGCNSNWGDFRGPWVF